MIYKFLTPYLSKLLPLFVNGQVNALQRWLLMGWLKTSEDARRQHLLAQQVKSELLRQPSPLPSPHVWGNIRSRLRDVRQAEVFNRTQWALAMGLAVLSILFVIVAMPPVNKLTWHVDGLLPSRFEIYRATQTGELEFHRIKEVQVTPGTTNYQFTDALLLPGEDYLYRVDAIAADGTLLTSDITTASTRYILAGQMTLIAALVVCLYGILIYILDRRRVAVVLSSTIT